MRNNRLFTICLAMMAAVLFSACEVDTYESGNGELAGVRADYADAKVHNSYVTSMVTDDGIRLQTDVPMRYSDGSGADTVIRRVVYYNKVSQVLPVHVLKTEEVNVLTPHDPAEIDVMKTDPVKLISAWKSANEKYVNVNIGIMVGNNVQPGQKQLIMFRRDKVSTYGKGRLYVTLYHDQADVPQYYTQEVHLSLRMPEQDSLTVTMNTYNGTEERTFVRE